MGAHWFPGTTIYYLTGSCPRVWGALPIAGLIGSTGAASAVRINASGIASAAAYRMTNRVSNPFPLTDRDLFFRALTLDRRARRAETDIIDVEMLLRTLMAWAADVLLDGVTGRRRASALLRSGHPPE
jgi:hypothetical protein